MENGTTEPDYETRLRDQVAINAMSYWIQDLEVYEEAAENAYDAAEAFMAERARRLNKESE